MPRKTCSFYSPSQGKWHRGSMPCLAISLPSSIYQNRFPSTTMTLLAFLPANLSASVIINVNLDIFSWTRKRTVLPRLNVNAAVWISPAKGWKAAISESLCFFFFFFPGAGITSGSLPEMLWSLLQLMGPEQHSVSIWQWNVPHSWTTPLTFPWLMIAQVKRKPSKGKMMRPQRTDTQTQSMDEVHEANGHLLREESTSNAFQSGTFLFLQLFSKFPNEQRKAGATTSSHNPFDLTNAQNITVKLIRGLTITECNGPNYPNHDYFPWFRFEAVSIPVSLQSDFHSVLSSYFCCFSQLLKHHTDIGEANMPMADRT